MKILHTSDWHLGHRLLEQSQLEEQSEFLDWLITYINSNNVDVLLVSGDVFDVGVPSAQAQKLYFDFLVRLYASSCHEVIIIGGNHDAPSTLNAPKELLKALSIKVIGKATDNIEDEIIELSIKDENLIVAAVPYLRDQDIRKAIAAETGDEITNRYKTALLNHYTEIAEMCNNKNTYKATVIAMGHLFATGGKTSESEQTIYVGSLGYIGADDFPINFDYIALGHLHIVQKVGGKEHIRYSGSPYVLSFSEVGQNKMIIQIETSEVLNIEEVKVPAFRKILQIEGSIDSCKTQLEMLEIEENKLTTWVEVILTNAHEAASAYNEIYDFAKNLNLEVLKVTIKNERKYDTLKCLVDNAQHVKTFTPLDVFKIKCEEQNVDLNENTNLLDAFNEILQMVTENE